MPPAGSAWLWRDARDPEMVGRVAPPGLAGDDLRSRRVAIRASGQIVDAVGAEAVVAGAPFRVGYRWPAGRVPRPRQPRRGGSQWILSRRVGIADRGRAEPAHASSPRSVVAGGLCHRPPGY
jgi:hypothetical protein